MQKNVIINGNTIIRVEKCEFLDDVIIDDRIS